MCKHNNTYPRIMKMCTVVVVVDVVRQEKRVWDITLDSPTRQSELA